MEGKGTSKKAFAGLLTTLNRLETSKLIASMLKNTAPGNRMAFLKDIAVCATGILAKIQVCVVLPIPS